jgi:hypothetical protein
LMRWWILGRWHPPRYPSSAPPPTPPSAQGWRPLHPKATRGPWQSTPWMQCPLRPLHPSQSMCGVACWAPLAPSTPWWWATVRTSTGLCSPSA